MEAEEEIDNETLQAKVDSSLAYVNDLVSSWMKPPKTPSTHKDVEKEIEELMRRPARLGVGAQPPVINGVTSREALRLKGRLVGAKKRGREEDAGTSKVPSDDDESRVSAIKKKPRLDPFERKTKKKHLASALQKQSGLSSPPAAAELPIAQAHLEPLKLNTPPALSSGANPSAEELLADKPSRQEPITAHQAGNTVLNLSGPPVRTEPDSTSTSPKKKRKKRKKKKQAAVDVPA